jgi:hypothetical protein
MATASYVQQIYLYMVMYNLPMSINHMYNRYISSMIVA